MTSTGTSKRLSRQSKSDETPIEYRTPINARDTLKKQQFRSSYTRPLHQNRYCFLEAHCLTSPSKRPRPRPRPPTEDPNTTAATDRHASVRTVQERLPNLQQFRDAGLAVTSVDQKGNRYGRENLQPVARTAEPVPPPAVKRRVVKLRPPPAFLMIKPLPATPCLPRQHDLKEGRGTIPMST